MNRGDMMTWLNSLRHILMETVKANADAIAAETTRATNAEAKALADAKAYTDKALEWIDAGEFGK